MQYKKIIFNILKAIPIALLLLIVFVNLFFGVSKAVTGKPVVKLFGTSFMYVLSGSMEPTLLPGDMIIISESDSYEVGDVVTYVSGSTPFTHRIIAEKDGMYTLKGDNNTATDEEVGLESIEGKLSMRIPKLGELVLFFKSPIGLIVGIILLICIFYCDTWYRKAKKAIADKKGGRNAQ